MISDLIEKLSKLDGPCRYTDGLIQELLNKGTVLMSTDIPTRSSPLITRGTNFYTASIDAALTLVPKGWHWEIDSGQCEIAPERWPHYENADESGGGQYEHHKIPAIAICIASLRAIEATKGE